MNYSFCGILKLIYYVGVSFMKKYIVFFSLVLFSFSSLFAILPESLAKRLEAKLSIVEKSTLPPEGWSEARLITPSTHLYLKEGEGFVLYKKPADVACHHYVQGSKSQALLHHQGRSTGASVDTSIHTTTKRSAEKKATYIQYDRTQIKQKNKDFKVDADRVNSKNQRKNVSNYDGGHLVDHKFSAGGSHTDARNYVPQHHFYNSWLKENLVKNASGYLEIPLYTKNPPLIKVQGEDRYDPIPIGILLAPLTGHVIDDIYYFPNNQYNYRTCQAQFAIKKGIAEAVAEKFKLKKEFRKLLWPALIHDVIQLEAELIKQQNQENLRADVIDDLIQGMSCLEYEEDEEEEEGTDIAALASDVIHQKHIRMPLLYAASEAGLEKMNRGQSNPRALGEACDALGAFLVEYALKNALKAELISTNARIMFVNIMTDFIECYHQVSERALDRVNAQFGELYHVILDELWGMHEEMTLTDLLFFANVYHKLSSPFIHDCLMHVSDLVGDMDLFENFETFIEIMKTAYRKAQSEDLTIEQRQNIVELFLEAQNSLAYIITLGYPEEVVEEQMAFLLKARKTINVWHQQSASSQGTYRTTPHTATSFVRVEGYTEKALENLGGRSSLTYQNDEESA